MTTSESILKAFGRLIFHPWLAIYSVCNRNGQLLKYDQASIVVLHRFAMRNEDNSDSCIARHLVHELDIP